MNNLPIFAIYLANATLQQIRSLEAILATNNQATVYLYQEKADRYIINGATIVNLDDSDESLAIISDIDHLLIIAENFHTPCDKFLSACFSLRAKEVKYLDEDGILQAERHKNFRPSVLFVFPGAIIPLNLGSHQRAFNLLFNLSSSGFSVDALVTISKGVSRDRIKDSLGILCNNVFVYKNNRKKYPEPKSTLRWIEKKWRKYAGLDENLPDLFTERRFTKPTESCKRWVNSLYLANAYSSVIVSYAWMLDCVEHIMPAREDFFLLCDTHDVQYMRNRALLNRKQRPFFSARREKQTEVAMLDATDAVIAISKADEKELKAQLRSAKVITASAGFDYALSKPRARPPGRPLMFGFIGGRMSANVMSLEMIMDEWWPIIEEYSPGSKLYVAGSICNDQTIQQRTFFSSSIVSMGFVKNLSEFYNKIDVSLNPVLVQGGLNFKSVEAVFSGKRLFTNILGMECLGDGFPATVIENPVEIIDFFKRWEFDVLGDKRQREQDLALAIERFGNHKSVAKLSTFLNGLA